MKYFCLLLIFTYSNTCLGFKELNRIDALPPMPGPDHRAVGWEWHYVDQDGNNGLIRKTADTKDTASYWRSDGCIWTRLKKGFAPALGWENCPSAGEAQYDFVGNSIWPLVDGKKFAYEGKVTGTLFKRQRKFRRKCRVRKMVRIQTIGGDFDTFKVVCRDRWITRTWWLSPEVGTAIVYQQRSLIGEGYTHEMTRIVHPGGFIVEP